MVLREKQLVILSVLCISALLCGCLGGEPASSEVKNISVGNCEIPLNFEDKNIRVVPCETSVTNDFVMDYTLLWDESTNTPGFLYIHELPNKAPLSNIEPALKTAMTGSFEGVYADNYKDGFIFTGFLKDGGQKSWGVSLPTNNVDGKTSRTLTVIAAFGDEHFNERLVKSISVEDLQCH